MILSIVARKNVLMGKFISHCNPKSKNNRSVIYMLNFGAFVLLFCGQEFRSSKDMDILF